MDWTGGSNVERSHVVEMEMESGEEGGEEEQGQEQERKDKGQQLAKPILYCTIPK